MEVVWGVGMELGLAVWEEKVEVATAACLMALEAVSFVNRLLTPTLLFAVAEAALGIADFFGEVMADIEEEAGGSAEVGGEEGRKRRGVG